MEYQALEWEIRENPNNPGEMSIGMLTLNRPDFLNAVDVRMRVELDILCDEIAHNSNIKVMIITGEGRAFQPEAILSPRPDRWAPAKRISTSNFGAYKEIASLFFNDLRHQVSSAHLRNSKTCPAS